MAVRNYLIAGGSGTGKTTVAEELQRRGYHVVHGDRELAYYGDPETGEPVQARPFESEADNVRWGYEHWIWPVGQVERLVGERRDAMAFFCGHSANSRHFVGLFDKVFVLGVDLETLNRRLAGRPEDEFGGRPVERELIAHLHARKEDLPANAVIIDANAPIGRVVDDILARCGATTQIR